MQSTILKYEKHLPHKQSLWILLPQPVSRPDLDILARSVDSTMREGGERIFINWWLASQDRSVESCWAFTLCDGTITHRFNGQTLEEHLDSVETRPLSEPGEIGLFDGAAAYGSPIFQLIAGDAGTVEFRSLYDDSTGSRDKVAVLSREPLKIEHPRTTGEFYIVLPHAMELHDPQGLVHTFPRLR